MIHSAKPTLLAGSGFRLISDGQTTWVNIVITTGLDCGRPRGSKRKKNTE